MGLVGRESAARAGRGRGQGEKRDSPFLKPLSGKIRRTRIAVFDFESKNDDTQEKGWTRPIQCGFDDGTAFKDFRNDAEVDADAEVHWSVRHLVAERGLVDKLMRFVIGHGSDDPKFVRRYQSKKFSIYSHNGGRFDDMFILGWLRDHEDEYDFEIASAGSRIQRLDVWLKGTQKKTGFWSFFDSVSLLPLSLSQIGKTFCPKDAQKLDFDLDLHEHTTEVAVGVSSVLRGKRATNLDVLTQALVREAADDGGAEWFYLRDRYWFRKVMVLDEDSESGDMRVTYQPALREAEEDVLRHGDKLYVQGRVADVQRALFGSVVQPTGVMDHVVDAWAHYNTLDNRTLHTGLEKFHDLVEGLGGEVGITAPATAMKLFRRRYLDEPITRSAHFAHCDGRCKRVGCPRRSCDRTCHGCAHDFVRRGYYGGRTEMHKQWGKQLLYVDVNSSYPASMLGEMPTGRMLEGPPGISLDQIQRIAQNHIGFVECQVEIPAGALPPLPYRVEPGVTVWMKDANGEPQAVPPGKLIFPTGTFSGVWSWEELKLLDHPLVKGRILSIGRSAWYKTSPVFREMVLALYHYRQKHLDGCACKDRSKGVCNPDYDEGLAYVAKLLLNSLYGKFGMREERTSLVVVPADILTNEDYREVRENGWPIDGEPETCRIWEVERVAKASYIIPQISAHITAKSRVLLFEGMADLVMHGECTNRACGARVLLGQPPMFAESESHVCDACGSEVKRGEILYTDTDSVLTNIHLSPHLLDDSRLGAWKLENPKFLIEGWFILPKLYKLLAHAEGCVLDNCLGCARPYHLPSCRDNKRCEKKNKCGCAVSKQRMKGVGSSAQTVENFDRMLKGETIRFERVQQVKTFLKQGWRGVHAMKDNRAFGGEDERAKKSLRTRYDKRQFSGVRGGTIPIHIAA